MQIDQLFEFVYILIDKKQVTAKEMSEHFGVSVRTIYRWIEALSVSGVPLYSLKGRGGGIAISEKYALDKRILSEEERLAIVSSVKAFNSLSGNPASAMTQLCVCALPAIRKMCGKKDVLPRTFSAVLAQEFHKKSASDRFLHGYLDIRDGSVRFIRSDGQGNAMLSGMIGCEAFVLVPAGSGPQNAGSVLEGIQL